MFWLLAKTPKPHPKGTGGAATTPAPTPTQTAAPASGSTPAAHGTGGNGSALHWLITHPIAIPILLVAALIGIQYGWSQLRKKQALRGVAVRPLGPIVRDLRRFMFKEDKRPLHAKAPWLTGTRLYLGTLAAALFGLFVGLPGVPWVLPAAVFVLVLGSRYSKVAKARKSIVGQMFAVANGECRYPRGAELQPWAYVNVANWVNLTQPGQTIVSIPAAYQSEDLKTREKFERQFSGTVSEENAWTYKWESPKNRIVCEPAAFLPNMAPYPGPGEKWDEIPVGVKGDGTQAFIPLTMTPHTLVCGPTGSGKSVLQRSVLFHVLAHSETWRIVAIDMKKVEMAWLKKYPQVLKVATDLEEAVEVLRSLRSEMMRRYEEMEQCGVNHAKDLPDPPKAILCMIDESTVLLAPEGIKSDEGKERDALHAEAGMIIGELGRLSRASMIHVMACFQRPDATFLKGETKANFDARIAAGRMDTTPSLMVLDSEAANRLPKIKGRGMIRIGGELDTFQGYFAEQSWFDEWLAQQEAAARGPEPEAASPEQGRYAAPESQPEVEAPKGGGRLKALAAKAAAKAAERAARMDAEAAGDDDDRDPVAAVPSLDAAPAPVPTDSGPEFDPAEDLSSVLERPAFDDLDDEPLDDDQFDATELDQGHEDDLDNVAEPEPVKPPRPVVPQPVTKPVPVYEPGDPLPDWMRPAEPEPTPEPTPPKVEAPVSQAPPRPSGLPIQRPQGLPTRPPQAS